jgi:hypothetical protein
MKILTYITMLLLLLPFAQASIAGSKIINFNSATGDGVCSGFENPIFNPKECDLKNFFDSEWFIKFLVAAIIVFTLYNPKVINDPYFILIIFLIVVVFFLPIGNFIKEGVPKNVTITNPTVITPNVTSEYPILVLEKSKLEKTMDYIIETPERLWPSHPGTATLILIVLAFFAYNILARVAQNIQRGK